MKTIQQASETWGCVFVASDASACGGSEVWFCGLAEVLFTIGKIKAACSCRERERGETIQVGSMIYDLLTMQLSYILHMGSHARIVPATCACVCMHAV